MVRCAVDQQSDIAQLRELLTGKSSFEFRTALFCPVAKPDSWLSLSSAGHLSAADILDSGSEEQEEMGNTASASADGAGSEHSTPSLSGKGRTPQSSPLSLASAGPDNSMRHSGAGSAAGTGGVPRLLVQLRPGERMPAKSCLRQMRASPPPNDGKAEGEHSDDEEEEDGAGTGARTNEQQEVKSILTPAADKKRAKKLAKKKEKRKASRSKHVVWGDVFLREHERAVYGSSGIPEQEGDEMMWILGISDNIVVHTGPDTYESVHRPEWPVDVPLGPFVDEGEESDEEEVLKAVTSHEGSASGGHHGKGGKHGTPGVGSKKSKKGGKQGSSSPKRTPAHGPQQSPKSGGGGSQSHTPMTGALNSSMSDLEPLELGEAQLQPTAPAYVRRVASTVGIVRLGSVDEVHAVRDPLVHTERDRAVARKVAAAKGKDKDKPVKGAKWHVAEKLNTKERQHVFTRDLAGRLDLMADAVRRKNLLQAGRALAVHASRQNANCTCKKAGDPYEKMNKSELEAAATSLGVDGTGTKAEILARVRAHLAQKAQQDEAEGKPAAPRGLCHGHTHHNIDISGLPCTAEGFWAPRPTVMDAHAAHARAFLLARAVVQDHQASWAGIAAPFAGATSSAPDSAEDDSTSGLAAPPVPCLCASEGIGCCDKCECAAIEAPHGCSNNHQLDATGYRFDDQGVSMFRKAAYAMMQKVASARASHGASSSAAASATPAPAAAHERPFTEPSVPNSQPQPLFLTEEEWKQVRERALALIVEEEKEEAEQKAKAEVAAEEARQATAAAANKRKGKSRTDSSGSSNETGSGPTSIVHPSPQLGATTAATELVHAHAHVPPVPAAAALVADTAEVDEDTEFESAASRGARRKAVKDAELAAKVKAEEEARAAAAAREAQRQKALEEKKAAKEKAEAERAARAREKQERAALIAAQKAAAAAVVAQLVDGEGAAGTANDAGQGGPAPVSKREKQPPKSRKSRSGPTGGIPQAEDHGAAAVDGEGVQTKVAGATVKGKGKHKLLPAPDAPVLAADSSPASTPTKPPKGPKQPLPTEGDAMPASAPAVSSVLPGQSAQPAAPVPAVYSPVGTSTDRPRAQQATRPSSGKGKKEGKKAQDEVSAAGADAPTEPLLSSPPPSRGKGPRASAMPALAGEAQGASLGGGGGSPAAASAVEEQQTVVLPGGLRMKVPSRKVLATDGASTPTSVDSPATGAGTGGSPPGGRKKGSGASGAGASARPSTSGDVTPETGKRSGGPRTRAQTPASAAGANPPSEGAALTSSPGPGRSAGKKKDGAARSTPVKETL